MSSIVKGWLGAWKTAAFMDILRLDGAAGSAAG